MQGKDYYDVRKAAHCRAGPRIAKHCLAMHSKARLSMDFKRKRIRGQNQRVRRTWQTKEGYEIRWRKEAWGVTLPSRYQALIRTLTPCRDDLRPGIDFVDVHRKLIKTLKAATDLCEQHYHQWSKATEVTSLHALKELFGGHTPVGCPVWAATRLNRRIYDYLTDGRPARQRKDDDECEIDPSSPTQAEPPSVLPVETIPAPPVKEEGRKRSLKTPINLTDPSAVLPAKVRGKGRKRRVAKRTKKSSKRTAVPASSTTERSRSSRKTKSKH